MVRGGTRAAATSKMECFVIIVNSFKALAIITKHSILDAAAALDPPLMVFIILCWMSVLPLKVNTYRNSLGK